MKFFFYSKQGDSLSTAERVAKEGNEVAFYVQEKTPGSTIGEGIVPMVDHIALRPDSVIVFDNVGNGPLADSFRKEGWPVFGASDFADRIELDRRQGQALMRMAGIDTPRTKPFTDFRAARLFMKQHPEFAVFKPNGNISVALTKVFHDSEEMSKYFEWLEKRWTQEIDFILQEKVEGVELSVEGWFNGEEWIFGSFNSTLEEKRFMNDGVGPHTGCSGNVCWFYKHARPAIVKKTLLKLTRFLKQKSYRGPLDINTKGGKGLEFTARLGYDAWQTQMGLLQMEVGRLLSDVARGTIRKMRVGYDFGIGVRLSVPPYPLEGAYQELEKTRGKPVTIPASVRADFHPFDLSVGSEGLGLAGTDGWLGVMTHTSSTLSGLARVYDKIKKVEVDELQYRTDILTYRAMREIPQILAAVSLEDDTSIEQALKEKVREYPSRREVEVKKPVVKLKEEEEEVVVEPAPSKPKVSKEPTPQGIEEATKEMWTRTIKV
jgi:phosphoribosylamine-glycine ligase